MVILKKESTIFKRNGQGELLPVEVVLENVKDKPTIKVIPMTKGDLDEVQVIKEDKEKMKDLDKRIIVKHCYDPKYTEQEIDNIKPLIKVAIIQAITQISLGTTDEVNVSEVKGEDFLSK